VLRGLGSAAGTGLIAPDPAVVRGVSAALERLIGQDGLFVACVANDTAVALPDRWSTRRGGFLAKAAAGIVTAGAVLPGISSPVRAAADATFAASLGWAVASPHDEVHPLLYAFEGVLALPGHARFRATIRELGRQFDALLVATRERGRVPATLAAPAGAGGPARSDIVAQLLRVGHLLALHRPERPPDEVTLARARQLLVQAIDRDGTLPFDAAQQPRQANVWAAMFADQALDLSRQPQSERLSPDRDPLLV
jgi:hypothetical protein